MRLTSAIGAAVLCVVGVFGPLVPARAEDAGTRARAMLYVDDGAHLGPLRLASIEQAAARTLRESGFEVHPVTPLARALFRPGMLVPTFDKPAPDGWPAVLRPKWDSAHAECRGRLRPADGGTLSPMASAQRAVACQRTLARSLFDALIEHEAPTRVVAVSVVPAQGQGPTTFDATVIVTDVATGASLRQTRRVEGATALPAALPHHLRAVLRGEGESVPKRQKEGPRTPPR